MQCALQLEKKVNQALLDLHKLASDHVDPHVSWRNPRDIVLLKKCNMLYGNAYFVVLSCSCVTFWRATTWTSRWRPSRHWVTTSPTCHAWMLRTTSWPSTCSTSTPLAARAKRPKVAPSSLEWKSLCTGSCTLFTIWSINSAQMASES